MENEKETTYTIKDTQDGDIGKTNLSLHELDQS